MGKVTDKAIRINEKYFNNLNSFLKEYPEIELVEENGKIVNVNLPPELINYTFVIVNNNIYILEFYDTKKEAIIRYKSPFATQSELSRIVNFFQSQ